VSEQGYKVETQTQGEDTRSGRVRVGGGGSGKERLQAVRMVLGWCWVVLGGGGAVSCARSRSCATDLRLTDRPTDRPTAERTVQERSNELLSHTLSESE